MNMFKLIAPLAILLVACGTTVPTNPGPGPNPNPNPGPGNPSAGTVVGQALDAQGKPIAGAKIWVKPVVTTGLYETRTDAQGRYQATGLPPVGYRVMGWFEKEYQGKRFCLRLGHQNAGDYSPVNPAQGAVRNLVWRTSGRIEDVEVYSDLGYFGGSVAVMNELNGMARNIPIEFTLTPTAPLIDGTAGKTLTRKPNAEGYLLDIPVGIYKVTATLEGKPVRLGSTSANLGTQATLEFSPGPGGCAGNSSSGVGRAYLYWGHSGNTPPPPSGGQTQTWDGSVAVNGGNTYYVRYIFTVQQGSEDPSESLYKGDFLECESPSINCTKLGWAQGVRQNDSITLITMFEAGGSFATDGTFSGDSFSGTTNPVFQGQTATVELTRQ